MKARCLCIIGKNHGEVVLTNGNLTYDLVIEGKTAKVETKDIYDTTYSELITYGFDAAKEILEYEARHIGGFSNEKTLLTNKRIIENGKKYLVSYSGYMKKEKGKECWKWTENEMHRLLAK